MMSIVNNFSTDANFWDANPMLKLPLPFKELYDEDKSKNKNKSSRIMWAIALVYDPESKFINLPLPTRMLLVRDEFIGDTEFNFEDYLDQRTMYEELVLTPARRQLVEWNRIMDEKSALLRSMRYTKETWEMIEKMLISNVKLYDELERISESLEKEGNEGQVKGGAVESASESKLI